jgi:hypothetical protein
MRSFLAETNSATAWSRPESTVAPKAWTSTPSPAGGRRAEGYENGAATLVDQRERLVAHLVPGPVEQHVKSRRCRTAQLFDEGGVLVVNGYFCAEVADIVAVGGASDSDDPGSCASRDLDGGATNAPRRRGDQHCFTRLQLGPVDKTLGRRRPADHKACGLGEVEAVGHHRGSLGAKPGELGEAASS